MKGILFVDYMDLLHVICRGQLQQLESGTLSDTAALADIADKLKKVQQQQKIQQQQNQQLQLQGGRYKSDDIDPTYTQRFDASVSRSRQGEHYTLFHTETYADSKIEREQDFHHIMPERLHSASPEPERLRFVGSDFSETRPRKEWEGFQPMARSTQSNMVTFDYGHQKVLGAEFSEMTARSNRRSQWAGPRGDQNHADHDTDDQGFTGINFKPDNLRGTGSEVYSRRDDAYNAKASGLLGDGPRREQSTNRQGVSVSCMEEMRGSLGYTSTEPDRRRGQKGKHH